MICWPATQPSTYPYPVTFACLQPPTPTQAWRSKYESIKAALPVYKRLKKELALPEAELQVTVAVVSGYVRCTALDDGACLPIICRCHCHWLSTWQLQTLCGVVCCGPLRTLAI